MMPDGCAADGSGRGRIGGDGRLLSLADGDEDGVARVELLQPSEARNWGRSSRTCRFLFIVKYGIHTIFTKTHCIN